MMRALLARTTPAGVTLRVEEVPVPTVQRADDVVVRVALAGVCRTDVYAADGRLRLGAAEQILGHELAGEVAAAGPEAGFREGDRVTVDPLLPCGGCVGCRQGRCARPLLLGVDVPGAFAEYVRLPAVALHPLPPELPWTAAAYAEPLAAALAVLKGNVDRLGRGLILGQPGGRIVRLVSEVLRVSGYLDVTVHDPATGEPEADGYDYAIETVATEETIGQAARALLPGGKLILKSRAPLPVAVPLSMIVTKELRLRGACYAPFDQAVALLADGRLQIKDLLGPTYDLSAYAEVLELSRTSEADKRFLRPGR